jgi:hypothetical protein
MIKVLLSCILLLTLSACSYSYCYKVHDVQYTVNSSIYTTYVCDEWRNTRGKYAEDSSSSSK